MSLKMTLRFRNHFRCCAATVPQTQLRYASPPVCMNAAMEVLKRSSGKTQTELTKNRKRSSRRHKRCLRKTVNGAPKTETGMYVNVSYTTLVLTAMADEKSNSTRSMGR